MKLPKVYHNDSKKALNTNRDFTYALDDNEKTFRESFDTLKFIDSLFDEEGFIFNKPVIIKTHDKIYDTAIVKRDNNYIYTLSEDIINLGEIISIERK